MFGIAAFAQVPFASLANTDGALSISEGVGMADSATQFAAFLQAITEPATMNDTRVAQFSFLQNITENTTVDDARTIALQFALSISENVSMADASSITNAFLLSITENLSPDTVLSVLQTFNLAITENLSSADAATVSAQMLMSIAENFRSAEIETASAQFIITISEAVISGETESIAAQFAAALTENTGVDTTFVWGWLLSVTENLVAADAQTAALQLYLAISENINARDSASVQTIVLFSIVEAIQSGDFNFATGWSLIVDAQIANWNTINVAQASTWTLVNDAQTNGWALVDDSQNQVGNSYGVYIFRSVATSGTKTIVVGAGTVGNLLSSSTNLTTWSPTLDGAFNVFNNIIYAQNKFYKFGVGLQSSVDGLVWTALTEPFATGATIYALAASSTTLVAVTSDQSATSTDGGLTWTLSSSGIFSSTATKRNLIWDGVAFVLGGGFGVYRSTNGLTWTRPVTVASATSKVGDIAWDGAAKYVYTYWDYLTSAFGSFTSADGVSWTSRSYSRAYTSVFWDGAQFVYVNFTYSIYTNDGSATAPVFAGTISGYRSPINNYALSKPLKVGGVYIWPGQQTDTTKYYFYTSTNFTTFSPAVYPVPQPAVISNIQTPGWGNIGTI